MRIVKRFDLTLRSHIGQRTNLHLKDGSVVINILITSVYFQKGKSTLRYRTAARKCEIGITEIDWVEPLNLLLIAPSCARAMRKDVKKCF